ncbi:ABC transporter permease [Desulfopila sp. IMCC35008]|uniref:ABC transporter permease n=1 Tax=Desulfopila sp. IMCC35008 TaxID=2653858 RepID=UPI0013D388F0|nr:ABC transporter permease [Desulfopila sp. IMCC35008]
MNLPSFRRIWAMFIARNYEFFRDRAAFGWNFMFPFMLIVGFGLMFNDREYQQFKVGVFSAQQPEQQAETTLPDSFLNDKHIVIIPVESLEAGEKKLLNHKLDLLVAATSPTHAYWLNDSSPNGALAEKIFLTSFLGADLPAEKKLLNGYQVRYLDWLFPGILAMNMMFSALWGVGYIVVRYRKNGALKRLKATPLTAFEYLSAQILSRIFLLMFTLIIVWFGADLIFDFRVAGSLWLVFFLFFLGGLNLSAMGLILAARGTSEEFASGTLNFISWPMMFLSEVWFSLEGSPEWILKISQLFPLTHLLTGIRAVMNDAATLYDVRLECILLTVSTILFLFIASRIFSWNA